MARVLIAVSRLDIREHLDLALKYGCGLELQAFSNPEVLDGDWQGLLSRYKTLLKDFPNPLASHGAFFDMCSASVDARVVALTRERYLLNLDIAAELGAAHVIFHTNFLPMIRTERYRSAWIESQVGFWEELGREAARYNLSIVLENMWDPDPFILEGLFRNLKAPNLAICLDISHAYLYKTNRMHSVEQWLAILDPYVIHVHLNNSRGVIDEHLALNASGGALNYTQLLPQLAQMRHRPWLVLEMDDVIAAERSLVFMQQILGHEFNTP